MTSVHEADLIKYLRHIDRSLERIADALEEANDIQDKRSGFTIYADNTVYNKTNENKTEEEQKNEGNH